MTISKDTEATIQTVEVNTEYINITLADGRVLKVPSIWFPRVVHANEADRQDFEIIGERGVAWFSLGEDLTIDQVLKGQGSYESDDSFAEWKSQYNQGQLTRVFSFLPEDAFDNLEDD
ncbi:MAG: DUF2442 domain-containing protein [Chloroflexota bacterium]